MIRGVGVPVKFANGAHVVEGRMRFVFDHRAYPVEVCRHCGTNIAMVPTKNGKLQPRDVWGTVHFATCPVLQKRRERKRAKKAKQQRLNLT